jgi:hypothetical protein
MKKGFTKLQRTDAERIADHSCRELAEKYLAKLEGHFQRRKFVLTMRELTLTIQCVDAYAHIRFFGERSVGVHMGDFQMRVTQTTVFDALDRAFTSESKLRKQQSHHRQQIKQWLERLQETEMLESPHLVCSMNQFSDDPKFTPTASWCWAGLPDDPVIHVRFSLYANKYGGTNFKVMFGNDYWKPFNQISELESYFNGSDVFKELDQSVGKDNFQFITPTATEAEISWPKPQPPYAIIPRTRLIQSTPHLLLMEASNPEILQARVTPTAYNAHARVEAAMQHFQGPAKTVDFVKFPCHPELQWDFHYAGAELEPEFGDDDEI